MKGVFYWQVAIIATIKPSVVITAYIHSSVSATGATLHVFKHNLIEFFLFLVHNLMTQKGVYTTFLM
jgi:hypothetical protein